MKFNATVLIYDMKHKPSATVEKIEVSVEAEDYEDAICKARSRAYELGHYDGLYRTSDVLFN